MILRLDRTHEEDLVAQARGQIVAALHAGILRPGDRLPSLRRTASVSGLNVKTVLRVYAALGKEGLVALRTGSGAFVGPRARDAFDPAESLRLVRLVRQHLAQAADLGLAREDYGTIVGRVASRRPLRDRTVVVLECNTEQVRLYAREIAARTGAAAHPLLVSDLAAGAVPDEIRSAALLAVTDYHLEEGTRLARRWRLPLARLRLRDDFLPALIDAARRGHLAMIVQDAAFAPDFKRAVGALGLDREALDRIEVVSGGSRASVRRALQIADAVYVSPLCPRSLESLGPHGCRRLRFVHHLADESIEEIEAFLLLSGNSHRGP